MTQRRRGLERALVEKWGLWAHGFVSDACPLVSRVPFVSHTSQLVPDGAPQTRWAVSNCPNFVKVGLRTFGLLGQWRTYSLATVESQRLSECDGSNKTTKVCGRCEQMSVRVCTSTL